ncbi:MAG: FmdB family zinc ribbon protein [Vicinamibacterales bacterium]
MPLYEYQCVACEHRFEVIQKFSDAPIAVCPKCQGAVQKLLSSPAIQFKGSGWYITDYARKDQSGGKPKAGSGSTDGSSTSTSASGTDTAAASADSSSSTATPSTPKPTPPASS